MHTRSGDSRLERPSLQKMDVSTKAATLRVGFQASAHARKDAQSTMLLYMEIERSKWWAWFSVMILVANQDLAAHVCSTSLISQTTLISRLSWRGLARGKF